MWSLASSFLHRIFGNAGGSSEPIPYVPSTRMFALVIGINEYHTIRGLTGAVSDANAIVEYLHDHLHVPHEYITILNDHRATRDNIIQALKDLASDPRIERYDPILIYYAGHGTVLNPPPDWPIGGRKIGALVPTDQGTTDSSGNMVSCIPDMTIGALLEKLAEAKGNNVMVVFDAYHASTGMHYSNTDAEAQHVNAEDLERLRLNEDKILWGTRAMVVPDYPSLDRSQSHVFLAAGEGGEIIREIPDGQGNFTKALLDVLYNVRPDKMTYVGVVDRLAIIPGQTPQCDGLNKGRVLFDGKVVRANRQFFRVLKTGAHYTLQAGTTQGVEIGAQFNLYASQIPDTNLNPALALFAVQSAGPFRSELEPAGPVPNSVPSLLYAQQTKRGKNHELKVYFTDEFVGAVHQDLVGWRDELESSPAAAEFQYTTMESEAGLVVGLEHSRAVYDTRLGEVDTNRLVRISHTTRATAKEVLAVIRAAKSNWQAAGFEMEITSTMGLDDVVSRLGVCGCIDMSDEVDWTTYGDRPVSSGGFGEIYKCKLSTNLEVAVKVTRLYAGADERNEKSLKRTAREIYTWSTFRHSNVQQLLGLVVIHDQLGMVTRWEQNGCLSRYLEEHPEADRYVLSAQLVQGLAYLHSRGVIHGDLKGANVLVSHKGAPQLTDFGNTILQDYALQFTRTSTRTAMSIRWAAPELFNGGACSLAADIYALGMTILETITGELPWLRKTDFEIIYLVMKKENPERPVGHIPYHSVQGDRLWAVLKQCWEFEPTSRPGVEEIKTIMSSITQDKLKNSL